jgi:transposase-like protein
MRAQELWRQIGSSMTCHELVQEVEFRWFVNLLGNYRQRRVQVKALPDDAMIPGDVAVGHFVLQGFLEKLAAERYVRLHFAKSAHGELECDSFVIKRKFRALAEIAAGLNGTEMKLAGSTEQIKRAPLPARPAQSFRPKPSLPPLGCANSNPITKIPRAIPSNGNGVALPHSNTPCNLPVQPRPLPPQDVPRDSVGCVAPPTKIEKSGDDEKLDSGPTTEIQQEPPRAFTAREKIAILRQHLLGRVPLRDLCEEHHMDPSLFYRWQKELFEKGAAALTQEPPPPASGQDRFLVQQLQDKLRRKDEILTELLEENFMLKKSLKAKPSFAI